MSEFTPYASTPAEQRRKQALEHQARGQTDVSRWADERNLSRGWDERAQFVASLVNPPARVIDLGCGAMALERELREGIVYIPADIVARDGRTHVFDMNSGSLPDVPADVAVALGLLEYAHDPKRTFSDLASKWPRLILSYHPVDVAGAGTDRLAKGWFTELAEQEIVRLGRECGYRLDALYCLKTDRIYDFALD